MMASGKRRFGVLAAIIAGTGLSACSGGPGMLAGRMPPGAAEMMREVLADRAKLRAFDANADQNVTTPELENGLERLFAELDTNKDGALKAQEISAATAKIAASDPSMPPLRDWNQSGAVEFDEFAAWNRGRFRRADANQDGTVTLAELTAPPKMQMRPPGGMPPGGMPPGGAPGGKPPGGGMPGGRLSQSMAMPGQG